MLVIDTRHLPDSLAKGPRTAYVQACGTTATAPIEVAGDELPRPLR